MILAVIKCLCVLMVILMECSGTPEIFPNTNELQIHENDSIVIRCRSDREMKFIYPNTSNDFANLSTSECMYEKPNDENGHRIFFRKNKTFYGDTGFYGCYDIDDEENKKMIYVFVKSEDHFFVEKDEKASVLGQPKFSINLPCRPTSPDYIVKLYRETQELYIDKKNGEISFDNKKGFQINQVNATYHTGEFTCSITHQGRTQTLVYNLQPRRKITLHQPTIESLPYIVEGQTVRINCSVIYEPDGHTYNLYWKKKDDNEILVSKKYKTNTSPELDIRELEIVNITKYHAGEYKCIIENNDYKKFRSVVLIVHDPKNNFINLNITNKVFQQNSESNVQWVVKINAYPQPEITWYDPYGKIIPSNFDNKYYIENTGQHSLLKITNLSIIDNGNYTMKAKIRDSNIEKNLNVTLKVFGLPVVKKIGNVQNYYMINDAAKIYCFAEGYPVPSISWTFEKPGGHLTNEGMITQQNHAGIISQNSTVEWTFKSSGFITCKACYEKNCSEARWPIFLTDVPNGFGILEPKNKIITVGDPLEVICAASIYNYTDDIAWYDKVNTRLISTDKISIINKKTSLSHISSLIIKSVPKTDELNFNCISKTKIGNLQKELNLKLEINDEKMAYFIETNLNETEIIYDNKEFNPKESITLKCIVGGYPPPSVNWYKDNKLLTTQNENSTDTCETNISNNNQILIIKYLHVKCSGEYKCIGKNRLNEISMKQKISINKYEIASMWIIFLIILFLLCLLIIIYSWFKLYNEKLLRKELIDAGMGNFEKGELLSLNLALTIDNQAELLPYDKKWEFPSEKLQLGKQLGSGAFGIVVKADAYGILNNEIVTTVAVKMTRKTTDTMFLRALASELKIMIHLGKHINVVNLLGACTKNISKRELYVIVEYCRYGNLHNYLLRNRKNFINQIDDINGSINRITRRTDSNTSTSSTVKYMNLLFHRSNMKLNTADNNSSENNDNDNDIQSGNISSDGTVLIDSNNSSENNDWKFNYHGDYKDKNLRPICTEDLILWAFQVARGMEYLTQRKVLHGDLAARNILLTDGNIVKICDFGLARNIYDKAIYTKKTDSPLPIKWMAIESIRDRIFSTQSDVWSFGIVLWELFTLGATPYPGMEAQTQYQKLINGYRMEKPLYATNEIYQIMLNCWHELPIYRQSFTQIVKKLSEFLDEKIVIHYINLNLPYIKSNTQQLENGRKDYLSLMTAPDYEILSSMIYPDTDTPPLKIYSTTNNNKRMFKFPNNHNDDDDNNCDDKLSEELSMINHEDDNYYLTPINIHDRRREFERMQSNKSIDNSHNNKNNNRLNYYNTQELDKILKAKIDDDDVYKKKNTKEDFDERKAVELGNIEADSFSNPSYMMDGWLKPMKATRV